jgi:hypothetical protein
MDALHPSGAARLPGALDGAATPQAWQGLRASVANF